MKGLGEHPVSRPKSVVGILGGIYKQNHRVFHRSLHWPGKPFRVEVRESRRRPCTPQGSSRCEGRCSKLRITVAGPL